MSLNYPLAPEEALFPPLSTIDLVQDHSESPALLPLDFCPVGAPCTLMTQANYVYGHSQICIFNQHYSPISSSTSKQLINPSFLVSDHGTTFLWSLKSLLVAWSPMTSAFTAFHWLLLWDLAPIHLAFHSQQVLPWVRPLSPQAAQLLSRVCVHVPRP